MYANAIIRARNVKKKKFVGSSSFLLHWEVYMYITVI